jgi:hypothetical protein
VFSLCSAAGASDAAARLVSLAIATVVTWRLNRRFTFNPSGRGNHAEALRYAVVALCAQGFNLAVFLAIRALIPALPALGALGVSASSRPVFPSPANHLLHSEHVCGRAVARSIEPHVSCRSPLNQPIRCRLC